MRRPPPEPETPGSKRRSGSDNQAILETARPTHSPERRMHVVGAHRAHRPQRNESRNGKTQPPAAPKKVEVQLNTGQTDKSHSLSLSRGARSLSALSAIAIMLVVKTRASAPNTLSHVLLLTPTG